MSSEVSIRRYIFQGLNNSGELIVWDTGEAQDWDGNLAPESVTDIAIFRVYFANKDLLPFLEDITLEGILNENNDAGGNNITNLADPNGAQDAATKNYVDNIISLTGLTEVLSVNNDANNNKIINLAEPTEPNDAATKAYVDSLDGNETLEVVLSNNNSAGGLKITNLADPESDKDAATKIYVDENDSNYLVIDAMGEITITVNAALYGNRSPDKTHLFINCRGNGTKTIVLTSETIMIGQMITVSKTWASSSIIIEPPAGVLFERTTGTRTIVGLTEGNRSFTFAYLSTVNGYSIINNPRFGISANSVLGNTSSSNELPNGISYNTNSLLLRGSGNLAVTDVPDGYLIGRPIGGELGSHSLSDFDIVTNSTTTADGQLTYFVGDGVISGNDDITVSTNLNRISIYGKSNSASGFMLRSSTDNLARGGLLFDETNNRLRLSGSSGAAERHIQGDWEVTGTLRLPEPSGDGYAARLQDTFHGGSSNISWNDSTRKVELKGDNFITSGYVLQTSDNQYRGSFQYNQTNNELSISASSELNGAYIYGNWEVPVGSTLSAQEPTEDGHVVTKEYLENYIQNDSLISTGSRNITINDNNKTIIHTGSPSSNHTLTIMADSHTLLPNGFHFRVLLGNNANYGISVSAGSGVTVYNIANGNASKVGDMLFVRKISADTWVITAIKH